MKLLAGSGTVAAIGLALALAGCSTRLASFVDPEPPPMAQPTGPAVVPGTTVAPVTAPPLNVALPNMTADGTQQFVVPAAGRAVLRDALVLQLREPISSAQVSNGWRTAAAVAQQHPNDYAACLQTDSAAGRRYFLIVVAGNKTSGLVTGAQGQQKCTDPNRVVQWLPFPEATKVE
jgi:hypothetical protein